MAPTPSITRPSDVKRDRDWPEIHWTRLASLLREEGFEIVAIAPAGQDATLLRIFSQTQAYWVAGSSSEWIMDALLGAAAYVGIDNYLTHLAALLNVKTVALHSQLPSTFLWPHGNVHSVAPDTACAFCRWESERGYLVSCGFGCSALGSIGPEIVMRRLLKALGEKTFSQSVVG